MGATPFFFPGGLSRKGRDLLLRTPRLLSLDFDGTLSGIAPTPGQARLAPGLRPLLKALARLPRTRLVFLSGRSIPDLKSKVRVPGAFYVGNHGMDFSPAKEGWGARALGNWARKTREARERLKPLAAGHPGAILEVKGPDLSLHYRRVKPGRVPELVAGALGAVQGLPVVPRHGKCVLEFKPEGAPGKAEALERLARRFLRGADRGLCLHVGDDRTDEEAFRVLRRMGARGLALKVGPGPTRGHYRLRDIGEVRRFLVLFLGRRSER